MFGKTPWEEALHDMFMENILEFVNKMPSIYGWMVFKARPEPEDSKELLAGIKETMCKSLAYIQSVMEKRGTKFLVENQVQWADLWTWTFLVVVVVVPFSQYYESEGVHH